MQGQTIDKGSLGELEETEERPVIKILNKLDLAIKNLETAISALEDKCKPYMEKIQPEPPSSAKPYPVYNVPILDDLNHQIEKIETLNIRVQDILDRLV